MGTVLPDPLPSWPQRCSPPARKANPEFAYVTMAWDRSDRPNNRTLLWEVLPLARAIYCTSEYPLLVLTNTSVFPDGVNVSQALSRLNAQVIPMIKIPMPEHRFEPMLFNWEGAYQKLQVWRLTQFKKVVWLDLDGLLFNNLDSLFHEKGTWMQEDNFEGGGKSSKACSGLMVINPSKRIFYEMLGYAFGESTRIHRGDQELIETFFADVMKDPVRILSPDKVSFSHCASRSIFSHGSECFEFKRIAEGSTKWNTSGCQNSNVRRWTELFCGGVTTAGITYSKVASFCKDSIPSNFW